MSNQINILSLFDGISAGQLAAKRAGLNVHKYYASEIDKYAISVTQKNFPETLQLGDILKWKEWDIDWKTIDLIIAGSPCTGFSRAGKQLNFEDPQSKLFFVFVDILNYVKTKNPDVKFLLENVEMKKEWENVINDYLGVYPEPIDSSLVSAQSRKRLYWFNFGPFSFDLFGKRIPLIDKPKDIGILLKDIIEHGYVDRDKSYCIDANYWKGVPSVEHYKKKSVRQIVYEKPHGFNEGGISEKDKFNTLRSATNYNYAIYDKSDWRMLLPVECERLQTLPDGYTDGVPKSSRYKMLGNSWTVDVIAHIFSYLENNNESKPNRTNP